MKNDLISRQAAIDALLGITAMRNTIPLDSAIFNIKKLPSIQPERIKGHWIAITSWNNTYKCSVCGRLLVNITDGKNKVAKNYPYCHCGADMRGEKDG